jgi:hypothetical protein
MDGELVGAGSHNLNDQGCTYGAFTLDVKTVLNENLGGTLGGTLGGIQC